MSQIAKKFITDNAVADEKIRLDNNSYIRSRNAADSADINLLKVNASDVPEFAFVPEVAADPVSANGLARKSYIDTAIAASASTVAKQSVSVVATSNLSLTGEQTIDGVLTSASRVLLTGQTDPEENGIYLTDASAWARVADANSSAEVIPGLLVMAELGTSHSLSLWQLATQGTIVLDTTALSFRKVDEWNREALTLNGTDITNQYKDLAFKADVNSIDLFVDGGGIQRFTADYTHSVVGGVSRLTFAGDLATGGNAALISGDILRVKYIKRS